MTSALRPVSGAMGQWVVTLSIVFVCLILPMRLLAAGYANYLFLCATTDRDSRVAIAGPLVSSQLVEVVSSEYLVPLHRAESWHCWKGGNSACASNLMSRAVGYQPGNQIAQFWLGEIQLSLGNRDEAVDAFCRARAGGHLYRHLRQIKLAQDVLRCQTAVAPSCFHYWLDFGDSLTGKYRELAGYTSDPDGNVPARWQQAEHAYRRALSLRPDDPEALSALGFALHAQSAHPAAAIDMLSKAFSQLEDRRQVRALWATRIGIWCREMRKFPEGMEWHRTAARLAPRNCAVLREAAVTYLACGRSAEALSYLKDSVELCPENEYGQDLLKNLQHNGGSGPVREGRCLCTDGRMHKKPTMRCSLWRVLSSLSFRKGLGTASVG